MTDRLNHEQVDELAAAWALDALDADEAAAVAEHLATCDQPHAEAREMADAALLLSLAQEPVEPRPELRARVMDSIAHTAQERAARQAPAAAPAPQPARRGWFDWLSPGIARPLSLVAVAAAVVLAVWGYGLQGRLDATDAALRGVAAAIADGEVAFRVEGDAGRGYVVDTPGSGAALVVAELAALPADQLYELWLLDAAGAPVAVGTFVPTDAPLLVVQLEQDLAGFAVFAVTVETERVAAPTSDPVMVGTLGS